MKANDRPDLDDPLQCGEEPMSKAAYFNRKLTDEQVDEIRKSGKLSHELAKLFNVSDRTIRSIRSRQLYRVPAPPEASRKQAGLHIAPKPMLRPRPCMCCRKEFDSEGNHNRLCCDCKSKRSINPYEVITGVSRRVDRR
jgi:hypothetical protein